MNGLRAVLAQPGQIVPLDQVQHFQQQETLSGRACLVNQVVAVGGGNGVVHFGPVFGKVGLGEEAASLAQFLDHLPGQLAPVELIGATLGHLAQAVSQVAVSQHLPLSLHSAVGSVDGGAGRKLPQLVHGVGEAAPNARGHRKALFGKSDSRFQQLGQGLGAEAAVYLFPGGYFPGHGNGVRPVNGHIAVALIAVVVGGSAGGRYSAAVDPGDLAGGRFVEQHEGISAH